MHAAASIGGLGNRGGGGAPQQKEVFNVMTRAISFTLANHGGRRRRVTQTVRGRKEFDQWSLWTHFIHRIPGLPL